MDYYQKFYRVTCEPLYLIHAQDFFRDLDQMQGMKDPQDTAISIEDFNFYFSRLPVWQETILKSGELNFVRLLSIDEASFKDDFPRLFLAEEGRICTFSLKILGLLICRGTQLQKADLLRQLLLDEQTESNKTIRSTNSKLVSYFEFAFFFAEVFPKKYSKFFEKGLGTEGFLN